MIQMTQSPSGVWVAPSPSVWMPAPQPLWAPAPAAVYVPAPLSPLEPFASSVQHEISPSQVATYADCQRKWGWNKLDRIDVPQGPSAAAGERIHAILEAWLQFGTPPDQSEELRIVDENGREHVYYPGKSAAAGLHHLPPPGPHLEIEQWIRPPMLSVERGFWNGRVDCAHELLGDPELIDHKSTGDLKWAKTGEDLRKDAQALIYAWAAIHASGASTAHLRWIYYQSRKPFKTKVAYTRLGRNETLDGLQEWEARAAEMIGHKLAGRRALDLVPNPEACDRFGGCPHRQRCNLTPQQLVRSMFAMQELSLEARIDAAAAAAGAPAAQAPGYPGGWSANPQLPGAPAPQFAPAPQQAYAQTTAGPAGYLAPGPQSVTAPTQQFAPAPAIAPAPSPYPTPWQPHQTAIGWEIRQVLDAAGQPQYEQRAAQIAPQPAVPFQGSVAQGINPPEANTQALIATPPAQTAEEKSAEDKSKVGDELDNLNTDQLKQFAAQHALVVPPRLRETNLRIAVRSAWKDKQAGVVAPAVAPAPAPAPAAQPQFAPAPAMAPLFAPAPQQPTLSLSDAVNLTGAVVQLPSGVHRLRDDIVALLNPEARAQYAQQIGEALPPPPVQAAPQPQFAPVPQIAPAPAPVQQLAPVPVAAPAPVPMQAAPVLPAKKSSGFVLFINAIPQKTTKQVLTIRQAFGGCFDTVSNQAMVADYRMVEHHQGAPRVALEIRDLQLSDAAYDDRTVVLLSTSSTEGRDLQSTLIELASEVVVGSAA